ncbi:MAG TPA: neutral/alkaline non-lysosomal ceramidase N-terminal domain-containing protein [Terriglobia bacterium]|nr:neutral/alkaline non-lysosomal ceramidase N-terminal domain-containing protein [Terriglobia bacterium]
MARVRGLMLLWAILPMPVVAASAWGAVLRAGVARTEITPSAGLPMYGYFDRIKNNETATGTLDPLFSRVLVLEAGQTRVAIVTLDLGRTFDSATVDRIRTALHQQDNISGLMLTASHTHSGPNIVDVDPPAAVMAWEKLAAEKIIRAAHEACDHLAEARLGTGYGSVYIGYNRRVINPDGMIRMLWTNPTRIPTSPVDPTVAVVRVDRMDGTPMAILVNYACHPVIFGSDNHQYSADYPGVMAQVVEQAFGERPICFFLQGADGDINPYDAGTPLIEEAVKKRDWTGEQIGHEVVRVAKGIQTQAPAAASLQFAEDILQIPVRWNPEKFRQGLLANFGPRVFDDHADFFKQKAPDKLPLAVTTLLIDKQIAFAGLPGEPFVDFQKEWRARCPFSDAFFLGYTNGYFDYFPTIEAASQGGYGAGDSDTYVAVGAGQQMVDHALERLYEMLDRLRPLPEDFSGARAP